MTPCDSDEPSPGHLPAPSDLLRPVEWENDISCNALDDQPFETLAPIATRPAGDLLRIEKMVPPELLGERSLAERIALDSFPVPVPADREGYAPLFDGRYWATGLVDHLKIMQAAAGLEHGIRRYLDFGCASGRVLRHFVTQTGIPEIWGSDINQRHIRWLCEHLPDRVKPVFHHSLPTLPMPDSCFDVISAFSVFTHLDTFETAWLAELRRILRPGGLAYLTVHDGETWIALREHLDNPKNRLVQSLRGIDPGFDAAVQQPLKAGRTVYRFARQGPYRAHVFHSSDWLRNVWGRFFVIEKILPRHHNLQTVLLLRKPGNPT